MSLNAPPIKAPFFEAEVEFPRENQNLPAARFEVQFLRTTKEWAQYIAALGSAAFFATFWGVRTVDVDYTVQKADSVILVNDDITILLPAEFPGWKKRLTVKKINAGVGTVTVDGDGFTIDGAATWTTTTQYEAVDFVGDGTNVFIV